MNRSIPARVTWLGVPAAIAVWTVAIRLVWEQTVWTWERGPQMVGFSLMHSGIGVFLLLGVVSRFAWPVLFVASAVWARTLGGRSLWLVLAVYCVGWGVLLTPYGYWQRLFISRFSAEQSVELMTDAAAVGDTRTVDAFLRAGVPINAQGRYGSALHAAAIEGELEMLNYLLDRGADVNAINPNGETPLQSAHQARRNSSEVVTMLAKRGGRSNTSAELRRNPDLEQPSQDAVDHIGPGPHR